MAANGISTLPDKSARIQAKIELARQERQNAAEVGYRTFNYYVDSDAPNQGRPWLTIDPTTPDLGLVSEDGVQLVTENEQPLVTE